MKKTYEFLWLVQYQQKTLCILDIPLIVKKLIVGFVQLDNVARPIYSTTSAPLSG